MHRVLCSLEHSPLVGCKCICRLVVGDCALASITPGREQIWAIGKLGDTLFIVFLFNGGRSKSS